MSANIDPLARLRPIELLGAVEYAETLTRGPGDLWQTAHELDRKLPGGRDAELRWFRQEEKYLRTTKQRADFERALWDREAYLIAAGYLLGLAAARAGFGGAR